MLSRTLKPIDIKVEVLLINTIYIYICCKIWIMLEGMPFKLFEKARKFEGAQRE